MTFSRIALAATAAVMALSPAAALANTTDSATVTATLQVPYFCEITSNNAEIDLSGRVGNPGMNAPGEKWGGQNNALTVNQNGTSLWTLDNFQTVSLPDQGNTGSRTSIRVDFNNDRGSAGAPGVPASNGQRLVATADGDTGSLELPGRQADRSVALGALINDAGGHLLAGAPYTYTAELTCVQQEFLAN